MRARRVLFYTSAALIAAGLMTCAGTANPARTTDVLDAGSSPIGPPPVDDGGVEADADPFEPFCDACAAR